MTTTMTTTASNPNETKQDDRAAAITDDVVELGTLWARYGLEVGRSAVEASARSLAATARLLGHLAEALDTKKGDTTEK